MQTNSVFLNPAYDKGALVYDTKTHRAGTITEVHNAGVKVQLPGFEHNHAFTPEAARRDLRLVGANLDVLV